MGPTVVIVLGCIGAGPQPLTLEAAVATAERQARSMIRARADVLLADVTHAQALSAILPRGRSHRAQQGGYQQ